LIKKFSDGGALGGSGETKQKSKSLPPFVSWSEEKTVAKGKMDRFLFWGRPAVRELPSRRRHLKDLVAATTKLTRFWCKRGLSRAEIFKGGGCAGGVTNGKNKTQQSLIRAYQKTIDFISHAQIFLPGKNDNRTDCRVYGNTARTANALLLCFNKRLAKRNNGTNHGSKPKERSWELGSGGGK